MIVTLALGLGATPRCSRWSTRSCCGRYDARHRPDYPALFFPADDFNRREAVSPADFVDWKRQADVFRAPRGDQLVGRQPGPPRDRAENVQGFQVSADFFPALGVEPAIGRGFCR